MTVSTTQHNGGKSAMKKIIGFVLLSAVLGGCAAFGTPDDGLSPSAFIGAHESRCENQARLASNQSTPIGLSVPRGDFDSARDINRQIYWNCAKSWP